MVNGTVVGAFSGTSTEVWVNLYTADGRCEFAGRFKYNSPKTKAKRYIKSCLERFSPAEVISGCKQDSPYGWARSKGYDPLTEKERTQLNATIAAWNTA